MRTTPTMLAPGQDARLAEAAVLVGLVEALLQHAVHNSSRPSGNHSTALVLTTYNTIHAGFVACLILAAQQDIHQACRQSAAPV